MGRRKRGKDLVYIPAPINFKRTTLGVIALLFELLRFRSHQLLNQRKPFFTCFNPVAHSIVDSPRTVLSISRGGLWK